MDSLPQQPNYHNPLMLRHATTLFCLAGTAFVCFATPISARPLKTHGIFSSNMVIQRGKPIMIWGWAHDGKSVTVQFGDKTSTATADEKSGRWQVTFPASEADAHGRNLTVSSGTEKVELDNILIGDVWVMNGQSNMAFILGKTIEGDIETAQAHLPLLRCLEISPNESLTLQEDLPPHAVGKGWAVATPQTAYNFSAIGYVFGARLQRALQIPIGIIDNSRGGASIESLVPRHMFAKDPVAARYLASVDKRHADFNFDEATDKLVKKWEKITAKERAKGTPEAKLPPKPTRNNLRSWDIPGMSPSDAASCYNGMFGAFKGFNIKGVLFHQGYNNAMNGACTPKRYQILLKLMIQGWREDFNDPALPVGVIGFCAGGISQTRDNFEIWSVSTGSYIREAQRLGIDDLKDPANTAFLPAYDIQTPGLHPRRKQAHGIRAARWALNKVYKTKVGWDTAALVSAQPEGDHMVLTFDKPVMPDDMSIIPKGFSIADKSGKFYLGHAAFLIKNDAGIWNAANKQFDTTKVLVWSPLVTQPVAVRYAWSSSPMGNLKVGGFEWLPLASFRTDHWDWPESADPLQSALDREQGRAMAREAEERCEFRRTEEAKNAVEILARRKTLGRENLIAAPDKKTPKASKS